MGKRPNPILIPGGASLFVIMNAFQYIIFVGNKALISSHTSAEHIYKYTSEHVRWEYKVLFILIRMNFWPYISSGPFHLPNCLMQL